MNLSSPIASRPFPPLPAEFGGIKVSSAGGMTGLFREVTVGRDLRVTESINGKTTNTGVADAADGAALVDSIRKFVESNPPASQGTGPAGISDIPVQQIKIDWAGKSHAYQVFGLDGTPETQALRDALKAARSSAFAIQTS